MREIKVKEIKANSALTRSRLPELKYALNPYLGCMHGCVYCYAMDFTKDQEAADNWGSVIAVRTNIVDVLRREVAKLPRGVVGISTVTDPYQPIEGKYRLVRRSIEILAREGFRVSVQTRSPLFTRDLDIMARYSRMFDVGMTITSPRGDITRTVEPEAPGPAARMNALRKASEIGIETWIFLGPIIMGYNDSRDQIDRIVEFASETGSRIIYDKFSPYRKPSQVMSHSLPWKKEEYTRMAGKEWWDHTSSYIEKMAEKFGVTCHPQSLDWKFEKTKNVKPLTDFNS